MKILPPHSQTIESLKTHFYANENGLTTAQVISNRDKFGENKLKDVSKQHWLLILLKQYKSFLIWVLLFAAVVSIFANKHIDAFVIVGVVFLNTFIGFFQELKAEKAVHSLRTMLSSYANVRRDGKRVKVPIQEIVVGDIVELEEGENIAADARILISQNLRVSESALTGESVPVGKKEGILPENTPMADQYNMVRKGSFVVGGAATVLVTAVGMQTAIGSIAKSLESIKIRKTNFQQKTDKLAKQMGVIAVVSASILFIVAHFVKGGEIKEVLIVSLAALVSSIPEGLPAVLTIVLAIGAKRMANRNAIIREFAATETLGAVSAIVTDKTGTLTQNSMTVRKFKLPFGPVVEVSGEGWSNEGNCFIPTPNDSVAFSDLSSLQLLGAIAKYGTNASVTSKEEGYEIIGDPTEAALVVLSDKLSKQSAPNNSYTKELDFPFQSSLKMRGGLVKDKEGKKFLFIVGAPENVLHLSVYAHNPVSNSTFTQSEKEKWKDEIEAWSDEALRVIALAYKPIDVHQNVIQAEDFTNLIWVGITGMIDPPRPDVSDSILKCKEAGIRVVMATGDHAKTALAIAKETGIVLETDTQPLVYTQSELEEMTQEAFKNAVNSCNVFARLTPVMKLKIATLLQEQGELIAMTGDGVNDAPALKQADVGVAMGIMGTDVARESANVVLADDNFSTIVHAVEEGRIVFNNTRNTSFFLLTTNFAEITTLLAAVALGMPIPLTATQILWLNLVTDGTCTAAMATESGHGNELKSKPVNPNTAILNKSVIPFIVINAVIMASLALGSFYWAINMEWGVAKGRTFAFIVMVFTQLYNVFNMRDPNQSIFVIGLFSNRYINLALLASIVILLLLLYVPPISAIFGFDSVSFSELIVLATLGSLTLWVGELYKWLDRRI